MLLPAAGQPGRGAQAGPLLAAAQEARLGRPAARCRYCRGSISSACLLAVQGYWGTSEGAAIAHWHGPKPMRGLECLVAAQVLRKDRSKACPEVPEIYRSGAGWAACLGCLTWRWPLERACQLVSRRWCSSTLLDAAACRWFFNQNPDKGRFYSVMMVRGEGRLGVARPPGHANLAASSEPCSAQRRSSCAGD